MKRTPELNLDRGGTTAGWLASPVADRRLPADAALGHDGRRHRFLLGRRARST